MEIHGNLVDIHTRSVYSASVHIEGGKIARIERNTHRGEGFILPGFVDAHSHLESSFLPPTEFARIALRHGTVATVANPASMANVLGISGIEYLLENARKTPFKFYFGAPSHLSLAELRELFENPRVKFLSGEVDSEKTALAKSLGKPIDGGAKGLFGENLKNYVDTGITIDHECTTLAEAREKHALGMKILIREGSLDQNFNALFPLLLEDPENCLFCTDHLDPNTLLLGHINRFVRRAVEKGMNPLDAIAVASKSPTQHYQLDVGLLRKGDPADLIVVENLETFRVLETYIAGKCVFKESILLPHVKTRPIHSFDIKPKKAEDFSSSEEASNLLKKVEIPLSGKTPPKISFIENFGLKKGALASSARLTEPSIIAVGVTDQDLCDAINAIIKTKGGLALAKNGQTQVLPLPIAGLLSTLEGEEVAVRYSNLDEAAKTLGCELQAPFLRLYSLG